LERLFIREALFAFSVYFQAIVEEKAYVFGYAAI
jgi:hypothetical protein